MRRLYHVLKVADAACVAVFRALCLLILEIFAQIAEGAGALDLLQKLRHELQPAVVKLRLHFCNILFRQIVMHN